MSHPSKRVRYDSAAAATAQYYNTTGTVPSSFHLSADLSYLITTIPNITIAVFELPPQCTEEELNALFSRYGPVSKVQKVCNGRAALIEFGDISSPTKLVHWAKINPFYIGVTHVRLEFSSQTITVPVNLPKPASNSNAAAQNNSLTDSTPSNILHLDVTNADYPITVDVLKEICQPHGRLQRIFIGKKNVDKSLEALVEFVDIEEAKRAQENLNGADIYSGCCSLSVSFSKAKKVHVTQNDSESWDFTESNPTKDGLLNANAGQRTLLGPAAAANGHVPPAPDQSPVAAVVQSAAQASVPAQTAYQQQAYYGYSAQGAQYMPGASVPGGYYCSPPMMPGQPMSGYPAPGTPYGMQPGMPPYYQHPGAAYQMYPGQIPGSHVPTQHTTVRSVPQIIPTPAPVHHVTPAGIGIGHSTSNLNSTSVAAARNTDMSIFRAEEGAVLMACNLPEGVNCDHLFNVLCLYGNIARIKFLKSRPGCAMIQMGSAEAADRVSNHLDGANVFGQLIQFHRSKQMEVQEHAGLGTLTDGSPVMKNYMTDSNNRFRNPVVAAKSRILAPTRTLHFFNAPLNFSPEDMCRIFTDCGVKRPPRIVVFTAKPGQKTSLGLAEWDTLSEALDALALSNHRPIHIVGFAHPFHLKLAFSPKPISDDRAGACMIKYPAPPITQKEAFLKRKIVSSSDSSGSSFPPHTLVTVAAPVSQAIGSNSHAPNEYTITAGPVITKPEKLTTDSAGGGELQIHAKPNDEPPKTFDVDELEAAENAYLANLEAAATSGQTPTITVTTIAEAPAINFNPEIEHSFQQTVVKNPTGGGNEATRSPRRGGLLGSEPSTNELSDNESSTPPRKVHQPPATPPSEPEDDD